MKLGAGFRAFQRRVSAANGQLQAARVLQRCKLRQVLRCWQQQARPVLQKERQADRLLSRAATLVAIRHWRQRLGALKALRETEKQVQARVSR